MHRSCISKIQSNQRQRRGERGAALIEFGLSWAVLWLLFAGLYQFGHAFYTYNNLMTLITNASQMGGRMDYDMSDPSTATTQLKNMVLYGDTTAGSSPLISGLASTNINVQFTTDGNNIPKGVTISIINFQVDCVFTRYSFNGKPRVTNAFMGRVICSSC